MTRLRNILALLRGQLWIVPAVITLCLGAVAVVLLRYGSLPFSSGPAEYWWLYSGDAGTARDLLASLLAGLMTMTSLVVSVTFVILTLSANQLGPRLISVFMADRQIQSVLGLFIGTILYLILVLRTLDNRLGVEGVPHVAVTVGSVLTVTCLAALLFYIHKIARSIIADNVVEAVSRSIQEDLREVLDRDEPQERDAPRIIRPVAAPVSVRSPGYIQVVNYGRLVEIACREAAVIEVLVRAGHYLLENGDHVVVHSLRQVDEELKQAVREAFTVASQRTPAQDPEYGPRQLVEIAVRALSPGINDIFTAMAVINHLGLALEQILVRPLQPSVLRDDEGEIRVVADRSDVEGIVDAAFNPIRRAGETHPSILIQSADTLGRLAPVLEHRPAREAVLRQLGKLAETARRAGFTPSDEGDTLQRIQHARRAIAGRWADQPPEPGGQSSLQA